MPAWNSWHFPQSNFSAVHFLYLNFTLGTLECVEFWVKLQFMVVKKRDLFIFLFNIFFLCRIQICNMFLEVGDSF